MHCLSGYVNVNLDPALTPRAPQEAITMAKNKNRKQGGQQDRSSQAERAHEQAQRSSTEAHTPMSQAQGSPADVARKHQKRFGHN